MLNVSNYLQQSQELPVQNSYQLLLLQAADATTFIRETSKLVTAVGLVVSASSVIFNFDLTIPLTCTALAGISWLLSTICAQKLEPQAEDMIRIFKKSKEVKNFPIEMEQRNRMNRVSD